MSLQTLITSRHRFAGDLARAADVAGVLVKYGLAGWLTNINWPPLHDALKSHGGQVLSDQPFEARVRLALTDLGTTFVKLGQTLSTRPDMIGQPSEVASAHLNAMNVRFASSPWPLTFSFSRAIQHPALEIWSGQVANVKAAQQALCHRAECNRAARRGLYTAEVEACSTSPIAIK